MAIALRNLPLPDDCTNLIQSYAFLDPVTYKNKLLFKSVNLLMRTATSVYNWDEEYSDCYVFRWYFTHFQHQSWFCKCGDYTGVAIGPLNDCCICKCI